MACYYREKGDAASASVYLKKAFDYKANVMPGETMPDPRFRRLVDSLVARS